MIFYNETTSNGKTQIKTSINISGRGVNNLGGSGIISYKDSLYKNLKTYWVTKGALSSISNNHNLTRVVF